jgi:hypothetical protein
VSQWNRKALRLPDGHPAAGRKNRIAKLTRTPGGHCLNKAIRTALSRSVYKGQQTDILARV